MKNKLLVSICLLLALTSYSQNLKKDWKDLTDVNFEYKFLDEFGDKFLVPEFGESVKKLENKKIQIKGYVLDLLENSKSYLLSKQPMASCFFCGMAGPETIIELQFAEEQNLKTDMIITVEGTFKLNKEDINHCNFIMSDVKIIEN
ncbi:hypothetical protein SAMN04488096_101104 [Mesonia phycicola]|uniref:DUF3299 domain-containing protein n=1 Tax=Mesonia phycicola TaxID=579105 RepID=A0A1M6A6G9_9FLAO|nr:hypothetical protein [Mesonia phycicola]SHI32025.1 hypothetical protein SAMN04488096_101104 [Mesonia phycicola]